jgi:hypothetical protein
MLPLLRLLALMAVTLHLVQFQWIPRRQNTTLSSLLPIIDLKTTTNHLPFVLTLLPREHIPQLSSNPRPVDAACTRKNGFEQTSEQL